MIASSLVSQVWLVRHPLSSVAVDKWHSDEVNLCQRSWITMLRHIISVVLDFDGIGQRRAIEPLPEVPSFEGKKTITPPLWALGVTLSSEICRQHAENSWISYQPKYRRFDDLTIPQHSVNLSMCNTLEQTTV